MKSLVFFVPVKESLSFLSIRQNLIRIPEVLIRLKEAEVIINNLQNQFKGFVNLISIMESNWRESTLDPQKYNKNLLTTADSSEDIIILHKKLSLIVSYVSQVGLFDRYIKSFSYPEFIMHNSSSHRSMSVSLKHCSMKKMLRSVLEEDLPSEELLSSSLCVIFKKNSRKYTEYQKINFTTFKSSFEQFTLKEGLKSFVHLGPGQSLHSEFSDLSANQFTELESISLDPILNWFWTDVRLPIFATEASATV